MKENLFGKGKKMHFKSKLKGERLIWLDDISERKLKIQVVVLKLIYNILRRKNKTIIYSIFIYQKWVILKVKFSICVRTAYTNTNENAPIFNKKT